MKDLQLREENESIRSDDLSDGNEEETSAGCLWIPGATWPYQVQLSQFEQESPDLESVISPTETEHELNLLSTAEAEKSRGCSLYFRHQQEVLTS